MAVLEALLHGATVASLIQSCLSAPGDCDGLLFGHVRTKVHQEFQDDAGTLTVEETRAYVTSFVTSSSVCSFYDGTGATQGVCVCVCVCVCASSCARVRACVRVCVCTESMFDRDWSSGHCQGGPLRVFMSYFPSLMGLLNINIRATHHHHQKAFRNKSPYCNLLRIFNTSGHVIIVLSCFSAGIPFF